MLTNKTCARIRAMLLIAHLAANVWPAIFRKVEGSREFTETLVDVDSC